MQSHALLVIDLQRGAFDGVRCPVIDAADSLLQNALTLILGARDACVPVIFIQHCEDGDVFEEGTPHWELHERLGKLADDLVIKKRASSAFENTELQQNLIRLGIKNLIVCGLQSDFCVTNTARSALELGYAVTVAADGHGTWPLAAKSASTIIAEVNVALKAAGARILSTEELAENLKQLLN